MTLPFDLTFFLDGGLYDAFGFIPGELFKLVGSYQSDGLRSEFQNGMPNGINILIWYIAFSGISEELAHICDGTAAAQQRNYPQPQFKDAVVNAVTQLCVWPDLSPSMKRQAAQEYWDTLVASDAPSEEQDAWMELVTSDEYTNKRGKDIILDFTVSALLNPYVLIRN